jgi:hypothetical protein
MKTILRLTLLGLFFITASCEKQTVEPISQNTEINSFKGEIFDQSISYQTGVNQFINRTGNWSSGDQSYAELGLATENYPDYIELVINSKIVDGPLTAEKFKALFAVGTKPAEGNFVGYHVNYRVPGQTYTSVGGEQPLNFLEVTQIEQLAGNPEKNHFKFKVTLKVNCNLYTYAAPHQYAGKIENGQLICYFQRN